MHISDKMEFKLKLIKKGKEGHFTLIKGTVKKEGVNIVNIHASNSAASNFIKSLYY